MTVYTYVLKWKTYRGRHRQNQAWIDKFNAYISEMLNKCKLTKKDLIFFTGEYIIYTVST